MFRTHSQPEMQLGSLLRTSTSLCFPLLRRDFVADRNHVAALILERWEMMSLVQLDLVHFRVFFFSPHILVF